MGYHLNLLGFFTFLLSALVFCHCRKVTVNVAGTLNCKDCIKQQLNTGQKHPGLHVTVQCKETKTHGTSWVDITGKFNVTLSAEITDDKHTRCYATLQSALTTQCPINNKARTASMKNLTFHHGATKTLHTPIAFSPLTCQSAFFWPFFKFPPTPLFMLPSPLPPITYEPPPVQLPFPPSPLPSTTPNSPLIPSLPPPGTKYGNPFPPPTPEARVSPPTQPPSGQECGNIFPPQQAPPTFLPPKFQNPIPPPFSKPPVYKTPYVPTPSPPFSSSAAPPPFPIPNEKLSPPPSPTHYRKPNPIPRPPPVPVLPQTAHS